MLWEIQARMKPALAIIDLIPNVHRTAALAALRRAVLEGRPSTMRLSAEDREMAFHDAAVQLTSPIGARVLKALYFDGYIKLKKPAMRKLPALDDYIATEMEFRADVARILEAEDAKRLRIAEIIADPDCARPDELSPFLIDKVMSARLGHNTYGEIRIGGVTCHKDFIQPEPSEDDKLRPEGKVLCWWLDADGNRMGDA
ncbi:hypothetical protein [Falsirhodobacter sp. alg1]|uniref:hypothetical protein n=1 Tax=Falsirhodobacter sp. alg1 TaxID=1472418 RepID=UPI000787E190|nr:hypothetical protein [Falsirhodobacter sp. alg1]